MRVREAAWRTVGPPLGRRAPGLVRAYYDTVTQSLVRALARLPEVVAVYARGSYALGAHRLGRSDVDLTAVLADCCADDEHAVLARLRARYRRRQAILPLDLTTWLRRDFRLGAPWTAFSRLRIGNSEPRYPLPGWRLVAGEEQRGRDWLPEPRLAYLSETPLVESLDCCARGDLRALTARLAPLAEDVRRERLDWPAAGDLASGLARRDAALAVHGALGIVDEQRRRNPVEHETRAEPDGWAATPVPESVLARAPGLARLVGGAPVRSLTLYLPPFEPRPVLLLEAGDLDDARLVVRVAVDAAAEAARLGFRVQVLTSRLAEDSWRSGLRLVPLAVASHHLGGEPLAPRLGLPSIDRRRQLAVGRALTAIERVRLRAVGHRRPLPDDVAPFELAVAQDVLLGLAPQTDAAALARRHPELAGARDASLSLRLWREVRELVEGDAAFGR